MLLCIREGKRRPPRAAEHQPALDAEVPAQGFDVRDQIPGGIGDEARVWPAATAAALVEQYDPVSPRVEKTAHLR
jgi:hypothetical protein